MAGSMSGHGYPLARTLKLAGWHICGRLYSTNDTYKHWISNFQTNACNTNNPQSELQSFHMGVTYEVMS